MREESDMAVSEAQFKELVKRVERLETGLYRLEITVERRVPPETEVAAEKLSGKERGLAALRRAGLLVDPPRHILAAAEEWRQIPEEERQRIQAELRALHLDPPLSQIILESRR
jgi:hypothetical protein